MREWAGATAFRKSPPFPAHRTLKALFVLFPYFYQKFQTMENTALHEASKLLPKMSKVEKAPL
jgi:hypothetical protein